MTYKWRLQNAFKWPEIGGGILRLERAQFERFLRFWEGVA